MQRWQGLPDFGYPALEGSPPTLLEGAVLPGPNLAPDKSAGGIDEAQLLLLALALAGCYSPNLDGVHYTCHDDAPLCPTGLVCRGSLCVTPGAGSESTDLAVSDGAVWDMQTQADMVYAWDPPRSPDLCQAAKGYRLS